MKKIYIALAVLGTALLSSCIQEKSFKDANIGENDIVITLQGAPATRTSEMGLVQKGATIELAASEDGHNIFLEETIEDLNSAWAPATKGTPAYTENLGVLYKNNMGVYASGLGDATYETMDDDVYARKEGYGTGEGWRYNHSYDSDPWVAGNHDFYFRMPVDMTSHGVSFEDNPYGKSGNNLTITFTYPSPTKAADQQDIIFAARNIDKEEYRASLPNGAPVLFNHALSGVKFAIANPDEAMITSVVFTGLKGSGTCTITPAKETNYSDTDTHSSATAVDWGTPTVVTGAKYTATFDKVVNYNTGKFAKNGNYPDSFKGAGSAQTNNLNDEDATQTFWFIPQAMTNDVKLHIVYTYKEVEGEVDIDFGKELLKHNANTYWYAGQLRTYTIRVDEVNVKIEDTVNATKEENKELTDMDGTVIKKKIYDDEGQVIREEPYTYTYYGGTKSGVTITNTGNTDAFIRAALIGQWLDEDGNPVFGFTDYTAQEVVLVDSWYQDQFVTKARKHGSFTGLVGYNDDYSGDWVLCEDGYYYYKNVVKVGATVPTTDPLFVSYTVDKNPAVVVAGKVKDVYFTLEISTQAVTAKKIDGSDYEWDEAWENALNAKPVVAE